MNGDSDVPRRIPRLRWWIIGVCFLSTTINYVDRQCLSVANPTICKEFGFSPADYASIVSSFMAAYAIMQCLAGRIADRIGARLGMTIFAAWWAVAGALHALCGSLWSFRACRFLLGMGEAGNWPSATKVVAEWFPPRERGLAVAVFDSGSSIGGVIAAPLVAWLIYCCGWRAAFLVTSALVIPWLGLWLWIYYSPEKHPRVSEAELEFLRINRPGEPEDGRPPETWSSLLAMPQVWGIVLARCLTDNVWWFYVYWLPKYLTDVRGFSLGDIAATAWIPFLAADLGNFGGGGLSSYLLRRGWSLNAARKTVMTLGVLGMLAGVPAGLTSQVGLCLALIAIATFTYAAWGTMILTLPADLFPSRDTASVSGLSGTGAALGGIGFTYVIGYVVERFSYTPIFIITGVMPLVALALVQLLIPRVAMLQPRTAEA